MKLFSIFFLILMITCSCSKNTDSGDELDTETFIFTFSCNNNNVQKTKATTKVLGEDVNNENKITKLDIFFFAEKSCLYYPLQSHFSIDNNKVTLRIPNETAISLFNKTYTCYILANCNLARSVLEGKNLDELKALVTSTGSDFNPINFVPQDDFLMDGEVNITLTPGVNNLGKVELKRAAAKIIIEVADAKILGYEAGSAKITLNNYLNKTALGAGTLYSSQSSDYKKATRSLGVLQENTISGTYPFYSYANNWEFDAYKETYITLEIPWKKESDNSFKTYYYRIPLNYIKSSTNNIERFQIQRNHIYQFLISINKLGSLDPENATELTCNFEIKDWSTKEIQVSILEYNYLVVFEREVVMNNISNKTIEYSSNSPIQLTNIEAYCYEYSTDGTVSKKSYNQGDPNFPRFNIDSESSTITLIAPTPTNYVPRFVTFTVTNAALLKQYVVVLMRPLKYITAQRAPDYKEGNAWAAGSNLGEGSNNPMGGDTQQNFNMFTITTSTLSTNDRMPDGAPFFGIPITLGDPTEIGSDGKIQTRNDLASNAIMSPQFVVASQRGITSLHTYSNAVLRCKGYQEYPYGRGTWRVPTAAELAYGNMLQNDPNSAVKGLFTSGNNTWWTAFAYYGFGFGTNSLSANGKSTTTYYIRCVHDTWKD